MNGGYWADVEGVFLFPPVPGPSSFEAALTRLLWMRFF
jgi:hypothetical protein